MKKPAVLGILVLLFVVSGAAFWASKDYVPSTSETGFSLVSIQDDSALLSDEDVLSFNSTSQEITLTEAASQRLTHLGDDLYRSVGSIKINSEEIFQGLFRTAYMSSIPPPPKISIYFPSDLTDDHALRLLYPVLEPGSDLQERQAKVTQYFEQTGKLTY